MNIIFFGTSDFAAGVLDSLLQKSCDILAIVTRPDRPQGRSLQMQPSPVKQLYLQKQLSIPLYQPERASTSEFAEVLRRFTPDLFVVVAYGEIMKTNLLDIPKKGCINIHPSLLPKYRGAAPIPRSLMDGCLKTGVSIIEMVLQMDAGDLLAQEELVIPSNMNGAQLQQALLQMSCSLVWHVIENFDSCYLAKKRQDPSQVTFAAKVHPEDRQIFWVKKAEEVHNLIRALAPSPGAWCKIKMGDEVKRMTIKKSSVVEGVSLPPGTILSLKPEWIIACGNNAIRIEELQLEGKQSVLTKQFINGLKSNIEIVY